MQTDMSIYILVDHIRWHIACHLKHFPFSLKD